MTDITTLTHPGNTRKYPGQRPLFGIISRRR